MQHDLAAGLDVALAFNVPLPIKNDAILAPLAHQLIAWL